MTFIWKGDSICQKLPVWQRNDRSLPDRSSSSGMIFRALPMKHYRREIGSLSHSEGSKSGVRVAFFETPGAISTNTQSCQSIDDISCKRGGEAFIDLQCTTNTSDRPCAPADATFGRHGFAADSALRRVRSAGMVRRNYTTESNSSGTYSISRAPEREYKTNYSQFLTSRAKTFDQNQFQYTRLGNRDSTPGTVAAADNIYVSSSINTRCKYEIKAALGNNEFSYTWINSSYTVTFADGFYDIFDLNSVLKSVMFSNGSYITINGSPSYLLELIYKSSLRYPQVIFSSFEGTYPSITLSSSFAPVLGLSAGTYPMSIPSDGSPIILSLTSAKIGSSYKEVFYKPNNPNFGVQGAVTSSDRLTRLKYNTVTNTAGLIGERYGSNVGAANKYIYSTNNQNPGGLMMRTKKAVVKKTPVFDKYTGLLCCKSNLRTRV